MSWKEIGKAEKINTEFIFRELPIACVNACKLLHEATKAFLTGDSQEVKRLAEEVIRIESEIDELKDKIMMMLGTVRTLPYMAIDYFTLVNAVEGVADRAEIAARLMRTHSPPVPPVIQDKFRQLSECGIETAQLLAEACAALLENYDLAWEKARACEMAREGAVELHYDILASIYQEEARGRDLNFIVKLTRRFALIADKAEETADFVRLLVIKYKV